MFKDCTTQYWLTESHLVRKNTMEYIVKTTLILLMMSGLGKGEPEQCSPVKLLVGLSGGTNNLRSASEAVLGVAGNLRTNSSMAIVALGSTTNVIFNGTAPFEMDRLEKALRDHGSSNFSQSSTLHGQQLLAMMNATWYTDTSAAKLSLMITSGGYDGDKSWEIRDNSIVTVVQLKGDHSWSGIAANESHVLRQGSNGSIPIQELNNLICADSKRVCGTTKFVVSDPQSYRCDDCRSICIPEFENPDCNVTCPYYQPRPQPEKTTPKTSPTFIKHESGLSTGAIIGLTIGMIGGFAVLAVAFVWYKRVFHGKPPDFATAAASKVTIGHGHHATEDLDKSIRLNIMTDPANADNHGDPQAPDEERNPLVAGPANARTCGRSTISLDEDELRANADSLSGPMNDIHST